MITTERARLARELHDGIAQDLVGVGYSIDMLLADPDASLDARSQLRTLRFTITELVDKVRREIYFLHQSPGLSLAQSIKESANELCAAQEKHFMVKENPDELSPALMHEIDCLAREILRNIAAHAQADNVFITLGRFEDSIELSIEDDGIGGAVVSHGHYGLQGIRDRVSAISGVVDIHTDAKGTKVIFRVPISSAENE